MMKFKRVISITSCYWHFPQNYDSKLLEKRILFDFNESKKEEI